MTPDATPASPAAAEPQQGVTRGELGEILERHRGRRGMLIAVLDEIQRVCGYLPEAALRGVAEETGLSLVDVYGVATFYKSFSLSPRGKHVISCCLGTACHVRGAPTVVEEFERQLGIGPGETTPDMEFTLETVNCLGACALGPVVVIDGHYFSKMRTSRVRQLIEDALAGLAGVGPGEDKRVFPIEVSCPRCNHSLLDEGWAIDGSPSIRVTVWYGREQGWLRLSSRYGSFRVEAEREIPVGAVMSFFCPHCHGHLAGSWACPQCDAPMVPMIVRGGGVVQFCSRRGCESHMLDLA